MTHFLKTAAALLITVTLVACSGETMERTKAEAAISAEDVSDMSVTQMADTLIDGGKELQALLATVDSKESAEAVLPELEKLGTRYQAVFERFEQIDEPSFADMTALAARAPRVMAAQQGLMQEAGRIYEEHPEAREVLREALEDFGQ